VTIRPQDVRHIAQLARLAVDEARIESLSRELDSIIAHMSVLEQVDTSGVPTVTGVGSGGTPLRADKGPSIPLEAPIESFAPESRDGFFIVPRLATHEDEADRSP
jgi:aspartyl-tRNA(Asn)/glutamyl-tRNA(Gln) amidotransferase subunit C